MDKGTTTQVKHDAIRSDPVLFCNFASLNRKHRDKPAEMEAKQEQARIVTRTASCKTAEESESFSSLSMLFFSLLLFLVLQQEHGLSAQSGEDTKHWTGLESARRGEEGQRGGRWASVGCGDCLEA